MPDTLTACTCSCHQGGRFASCNVPEGCAHLHGHTAGCHVCSSPTGDTGHLCRIHTADLEAELRDVPDLVAELEVTTTRQDRVAAEKHGGRSATKPLPWNEHAATKRFELNATLNAWALDCDRLGRTDERDQLADNPHTDTAAVASWLARNVRHLRHHPEAGTAHEEIVDSIRQARRAIDKPPDQAAFGPCGHTGDPDDPQPPCEEYLYAIPGKPTVVCRGCGARHGTALRKAWMLDYARDMLGTTGEVAGYLNLAGIKTSSDAIRALANRDRGLAAAGVDQRGRPLYRFADVIAAIGDRYKRRPQAA